MKASTRSGSRSPHSGPWLNPSNVTVPIITATSATVPAAASSEGRPPSGGRTPTTPHNGRRPAPEPRRVGMGRRCPGSAPVVRPIARYGLKARNTSPNSSDSTTSPTQKMIRMNVGARFPAPDCSPA